ncbi:MAG: hypothetical protein HY512_00985 [Candidatus Aenigmarchaeota archaeon]|nr:hypothetical protein [Candidatus Aenigmarchaeota archaeon]
MIYIPRFLRTLGFVAAFGLSVLGGCKGGDDKKAAANLYQSIFSSISDDEPGLLDGNFPTLYAVYSNNTNNSSGYVEMATIHSALAPGERVSGVKIIGNQLYLRVEVSNPLAAAATGFSDNGGPKSPDYVGVATVKDSAGMRSYMEDPITPSDSFRQAGFFFNTSTLPKTLDPSRPPARVGSAFDPNNPIRSGLARVNYGSLQNPVQVSLPTGVADVDLFIEGSKDRIIDFNPTPSDRQTLEALQKHPGYDPSTLEAVIISKPTRLDVDHALFGYDF